MERIDKIICSLFILGILFILLGIGFFFQGIDTKITEMQTKKNLLDDEYYTLHTKIEKMLNEEII